MVTFLLGVAGFIIEVTTPTEKTKQYCRYYRLLSGTPDFRITVTEEEALSEDEVLFVQRKISEKIPEYGCFLMHASCFQMDGDGYALTAPSGTGKSTHAGLWREYFGDRVQMINDDKPFVRIAPDGVYLYGSPWCGKHRLQSNVKVRLKAVAVLHQAKENAADKMNPFDAYLELLKQIYYTRQTEIAKKVLSLMEKLVMSVPVYAIGLDISEEALKTSYEAMSGKNYEEEKAKNSGK